MGFTRFVKGLFLIAVLLSRSRFDRDRNPQDFLIITFLLDYRGTDLRIVRDGFIAGGSGKHITKNYADYQKDGASVGKSQIKLARLFLDTTINDTQLGFYLGIVQALVFQIFNLLQSSHDRFRVTTGDFSVGEFAPYCRGDKMEFGKIGQVSFVRARQFYDLTNWDKLI